MEILEAKIALHYDLVDLSLNMFEECSELIQALAKYDRTKGHGLPTSKDEEEAMADLVEEIGDVLSCIDRIKLKPNINDTDIHNSRLKKAVREIERMKNK